MNCLQAIWWILLSTFTLRAEVVLAPLFQDGAVLQRDKPVVVWGRATSGSTVTVTFGDQSPETTADAQGRWQITLTAMAASATPRPLTAAEAGIPGVVVNHVQVGEVWLASGQSNMEWPVKSARKEDQELVQAETMPLVHLFQVPHTLQYTRLETVNARWMPATPQNIQGFSAVAFFFGQRLAAELKVPIGIIHSSWSGSKIEPWWAEEGLAGINELAAVRDIRLAKSPGFPPYEELRRKHLAAVRQWTTTADEALAKGIPSPALPTAPPLLALGHASDTGTYQAMIHPLVPYALRGFIWYQGESNVGDGMLYTAKMRALINGWRQQFRAPDAPFLFVQLAPNDYGPKRDMDLPAIWWAQQAALKIPHTGMVVTNDIGDVRDIHPRNKSEVGRRLALWALADTYGHTDLVKSGPLFAACETTAQGLVLRFEHTGSGLVTRDGKPPNGFELAGSDAIFHPAEARITADGKAVVLISTDVPSPDRARFAWSQLATPNLMNREGLPAAAFQCPDVATPAPKP